MPATNATPVVYFDEAGNTGAQLLDPEQPVFTLASVDFTDEECEQLLAIVRTPQATDAKFTALRKSASGQARLLNFIRSPLLTPSRAKVTACGYRNASRFKVAVYFHCGGLDLWPRRWTHSKA